MAIRGTTATTSACTSTKYAMRVTFKGSHTWPKENTYTKLCLNKQNGREARPKTAFQIFKLRMRLDPSAAADQVCRAWSTDRNKKYEKINKYK